MLENTTISTRILGGFGVILALLLGLAIFTYSSAADIGRIFTVFRQEAATQHATSQVQDSMSRAQLAVAQFHNDPSAPTGDALDAAVHELIERAGRLNIGAAPQISAAANDYAARAEEFRTATRELVEKVAIESELAINHRREIGELTQLLEERGATVASYNSRLASEALLVARARIDRFLGGAPLAELEAASEPLEQTAEYLDTVVSSSVSAAERAAALRVRAGHTEFRNSVAEAKDAELARRTARQRLDAAAPPLADAVESARAAAVRVQEEYGRNGDERLASTLSTVIIVASIALLSGTCLAWIMGRWISGAVSRMAITMQRLADGNFDTEITGDQRRTELGEMARSLQVFKTNGIAAREAERQAERTRLDQERVVRDLTDGLGRLAAGDLTQTIANPPHDPFPPEYEQLRMTFNELIETLSGIVSAIMESAGGVRSGAGEIAQVAQDLSSRAETQAATLEQSAAALGELTESVRSTAAKAAQADRATLENQREAEAGGAVVREAVAAMRQIEKSSEQITRIIGVIDDISFQTNLLALNAGVEAARAGEAGRGFAVVASEVRALAQRASGSAKEIKALISESSQQVSEGSTLVSRTGESLEEILRRVSDVSSLVSEIANAATEQAKGLSEINTGVNQIDVVTQQNAAVAEQSTAAASSLLSEAEQLTESLSGFRVAGSGISGRGASRSVAARATPIPASRPAPKKAAAGGGGWEDF